MKLAKGADKYLLFFSFLTRIVCRDKEVMRADEETRRIRVMNALNGHGPNVGAPLTEDYPPLYWVIRLLAQVGTGMRLLMGLGFAMLSSLLVKFIEIFPTFSTVLPFLCVLFSTTSPSFAKRMPMAHFLVHGVFFLHGSMLYFKHTWPPIIVPEQATSFAEALRRMYEIAGVFFFFFCVPFFGCSLAAMLARRSLKKGKGKQISNWLYTLSFSLLIVLGCYFVSEPKAWVSQENFATIGHFLVLYVPWMVSLAYQYECIEESQSLNSTWRVARASAIIAVLTVASFFLETGHPRQQRS